MDSTSTSTTHVAGFDETTITEAIGKILLKRNELHDIQMQLKKKLCEVFKGKSPVVTAKTLDASIIDKLILEYFDWFGYRYTMETFTVESGTTKAGFSTRELIRMKDNNLDKEFPLLLQAVMELLANEQLEKEKHGAENIENATD